MKLNTKQFKEALNNTLNFVQLKSTLPINTYLVFKAKDNKLVINANSLEGLTSSYLTINNPEKEEFSFMVSEVTDLNKIIGTIHNLEFDFVVEENLLIIQVNKNKKFELGTIDYEASSYEKNSIVDKFENVNLKQLQEQLSKINKFASSDELRPVLCGVNINKDHFVATNQFYLYKITNSIFKDIKEPITLDYAFINKLAKVKGGEFVNVIITKKTFTIQSVGFTTTTRLIDGDYPNYRAIIPECYNSISVDKIDLINSIKEAMIISNHSSLVEFKTSDSSLEIKSKDIDFRKQYSDKIELTNIKGDELSIGTNAALMLELLSTIDDESEDIIIQHKANNIAMLVHGSKETDEQAIGLIMPMMIN